jgi:hypothetical protein
LSSAGKEFLSGGPWSLLEVLTFFARPFVLLGEKIHEMRAIYIFLDDGKSPGADELQEIQGYLTDLLAICDRLNMPVSKHLLGDAKKDPPHNYREFEILMKAIYAEIADKLMVFVPSNRRKYFAANNFIDQNVPAKFPGPYSELQSAGRCFAVGLHTAAVFHAMRAVEVGLKAMCRDLNVELPISLENADWETLIRQMESKVQTMKDLPKTDGKADRLHFYSEACMQFRYFKDGWRVRVAHAKATYVESEALTVLDHAQEFFKILSAKLDES